MHLFVYYKFKPEAYPNVARDAGQLLATIEQSVPGIRVGLLKRPELSANGEQTWMETYEFDSSQKTLLESRLSELMPGSGLPDGRRAEWFVEV